ncbi:MAG: HDOD domain-containing protein, partial [Phycisphaerae bacterium]|nr:HDOD domain-containing protein [Gemmatimonadaceae bacterium]
MRATIDAGRPSTSNRGDSSAEPASPIRARLTQILSGSDFPALSQQIVDTISVLDDDASSLQRLANVVLREYSLTLSVVRTANSAHYRRTGRPIQSATHAMMMLGARTVRHLASSLLLFENYSRRSSKLKELMLLSLLSANHAREAAVRLGTCDPEEAHLCGMFRNLGEVLVACHFPEDYARIETLIQDNKRSATSVTNEVLGFRYEELGVALSKHWGMPESVMTSMCARALSPLSEVGGITAFSHDLTLAIYRVNDRQADGQKALDEVIERYAPRLKLTRAAVAEIVEAALTETRELFANVCSPTDSVALRHLSATARKALGTPVHSTAEWDVAALTSAPENPTLALRDKLRVELENSVDPASGNTLGAVLLLALEASLRGAPFDRVIACVLNADRTQLTARTALGVGAEALMAQFDFPMSPRGGPVVTALLQRQPICLPADRAMTVQETRWAHSMNCAQFGVFPIIVAMKIVGCLYVDRLTADAPIDRATLNYVKSLCELVAKAIAARRGAPASGVAAAVAPNERVTTPTLTPSNSAPVSESAHKQVPAAWNASLEASLASKSDLSAESKGALVLRLLQGEHTTA